MALTLVLGASSREAFISNTNKRVIKGNRNLYFLYIDNHLQSCILGFLAKKLITQEKCAVKKKENNNIFPINIEVRVSSANEATRNWAPRTKQGKAFGILESGRGVVEVASSTALLAVFAKMGSGRLALSWVIILFSVLNLLIGLLTWFSLEDSTKGTSRKREEKIGIRNIIMVLKMPVVWLISLVILAAYSAYWGSYYFTPFATDVFMMSVVFGGALGVGKMWLKPLSALGAGFLGDRIGASKTVALCFVILIISFGVFIFTPGRASLVLILVINTAIAALAIFALQGNIFCTSRRRRSASYPYRHCYWSSLCYWLHS